MLSTEKPIKSFWDRPEGKTGMIFAAGIVVGVGYLLYKFLPYIITLLQNTIYAVILFAVLGALIYILLDPRFRNLVWYLYKAIMRFLTGVFVQIDPIAILKAYVEYLYNNQREMNGHVGKLKGQMQKLKTIINENKAEMEQSLKVAEQAKKQDKMELVAVNTRQYGRLKEANERYHMLYTKMELLYRVLSKIYTNSGYLIKDIENEVRMREQERAAIRAGHSAMKSAMSIISGDPDKKAIFDMAMESIVDDVSNKIGEMERFIEISSTFIESVDLQNGVFEQEGLALLEKMEKDGSSFLLGEVKLHPELEPLKSSDTPKELDQNFSKYSNLFD